MAKILVQTTIAAIEDDWNVGRFSKLCDELRSAGHDVTARNREAADASGDPVLLGLPGSAYDQLWLLAVDTGEGLTQAEADAILAFRARGGGVLTARDHQDLGSCLSRLGSLGVVNHFNTHNPEAPDRCVADDRDNPNISYPNYHSGANGDYQAIEVVNPPHQLLRSGRAPQGVIEYFPAHPHEGAVDAPPDEQFARVLARGRSRVTGRPFNLAVAIEGESTGMGRAIAESTFHHFADMNWDPRAGAPSFVTDKPGSQIQRDPDRLEIFKDYIRNAARWLSPN